MTIEPSSNFDRFVECYRALLKADVLKHPTRYPWYPRLSIETVFGRMKAAFRAGTYDKDSASIRATCKALGINHSYKAIDAYLKGDGQ